MVDDNLGYYTVVTSNSDQFFNNPKNTISYSQFGNRNHTCILDCFFVYFFLEIATWHHWRPESNVCCILQCFFKLFMIPRCDFRAQRVPQSIKMLTPLNGFCLFWHLENWQKRVQNVHKMWNGTTVLRFCLLFWALKIRKHTFADRRNVFSIKYAELLTVSQFLTSKLDLDQQSYTFSLFSILLGLRTAPKRVAKQSIWAYSTTLLH